MKRTKAQNEVLDTAILETLGDHWWETAESLTRRVRIVAEERGFPIRVIDSTVVGARLRGLKARGKVEGRLLDGYMNEWRKL
jgi:hypothetical protein